MKLPDLDKLPKDRRDWLEVFGNQWGTKKHGAERMTTEENAMLLEALNPFGKPISAEDRVLLRLLDFVDRYHGVAKKQPVDKTMPGTCEACVWGTREHSFSCVAPSVKVRIYSGLVAVPDAPIYRLDV